MSGRKRIIKRGLPRKCKEEGRESFEGPQSELPLYQKLET